MASAVRAVMARKMPLVSLAFAVTAFAAAIIRFNSDKETLQAQAIQWFFASLGTAMIPTLKYLPGVVESIQFGQGGAKVTLKEVKDELSSSIKEIKDQVDSLDRKFIEALDQAHRAEASLSADAKLVRQQNYDAWTENVLNNMGETDRLATQEMVTFEHLAMNGISVSQIKSILRRLRYYRGSIDENFNSELAQAVTEFQKQHLQGVPDGIPGSITLARLREVYPREFPSASPTSPFT